MIEIVTLILLLHAPDGHEVRIVPDEITTMHSPAKPRQGHYPHHANCLINLADGKFVAVVEHCNDIQKQVEQQK